MKYFTIAEMTRTSQPFDNNPGVTEINHLQCLISEILDPLREAWGSPINVNSGYRSPLVNKAVGGAANSSHLTGWAADLYPKNGDFNGFKKFVVEFMKGRKFDQCIIEKNSRGSEWIHIGLKRNDGSQRGQIFSLSV